MDGWKWLLPYRSRPDIPQVWMFMRMLRGAKRRNAAMVDVGAELVSVDVLNFSMHD